jgi:transcriptional regulator with XRE-family HTH domain
MAVRDPTIGARVARAREAKGLSPSELARLIDVKPQAIYMLEAGKVNAPTPANLFKIADALGVSPRDLVFGEQSSAVAHRATEPASTYSVEQVFDPETLLFAQRFQQLDAAQRREWMLSMLLAASLRPGERAAPVTLTAPRPLPKPKN